MMANSFNGNIGSWDVSNVTKMSYMFYQAPMFNQDIGSWDVSSVRNMDFMFFGAKSFSQDINSWNVDNGTDLKNMFNSATAFLDNYGIDSTPDIAFWTKFTDSDLKTTVDEYWPNDATEPVHSVREKYGDIRGWNVSQVTNMDALFRGKSNFNEDISSWNVSNVKSLYNCFRETSFNQDIGNWDVSNVTNMKGAFKSCKLNQDI